MLADFARNLPAKILLLGLATVAVNASSLAQTTDVVDQFDAAGIGPNNYAAGQITNVWENWFGSAFRSLAWDSTSDASTNSGSGSLKITATFDGSDGNSQWAVYDVYGIYPPVNGGQYTNFQCDIRFAAGSATTTNQGQPLFGHMIFGVANGWSQDWFGSFDVTAAGTNWVHVSVPVNAQADPNLSNIYNVIIHLYGPYYTPMTGTSTCWVDNVQFFGTPPVTSNCVVNWNDVHQRIDGFGASSGFLSSLTTNQADLFFSTNLGAGLSLLKSVIVAGTTVETNIMQMAQARGARVWCTPYSPNPAFKSNGNIDGGSFLSASNQAYASELAGFVAGMNQNYGINVYALSIQNEPDVAASYQSCLWNPQQIHDFVPYLQSALLASNVASTKIMLAEDENWQTNYYEVAMNDPAVATKVGIIACHDYDGAPPSILPVALPKLANTNAALWESEVSTYDPFDGSMTNAMYWANRIHLFMTIAEANAFNYWWIMVENKNDNEGLTDLYGNPAKRLYVLGNYSRFIRPGFYRIGVVNNAQTEISAYKDPASGNFAIVAANPGFNTVTQTFSLAAFTANSVTPWITSDALSLSNEPPIGVSNSVFAYTLPPLSVVTFAGQSVPILISIQQAATNVVLSWPQGTLLSATNITGPWTTNSATSPYTNPSISPQQFYRTLVQPAN